MNERYSPAAINDSEPRQPESKIGIFFGEFPWLRDIIREIIFPKNYRLNAILMNVRVARMHKAIAGFVPSVWTAHNDLVETLKEFSDQYKKRTTIKMSWYIVDDNNRTRPLPVGIRKKWNLVSRPTWYAPWASWKVEWSDFKFHESVLDAIVRVHVGSSGVRYVVQIGTLVENYVPWFKAVIYKIPKGFTLMEWLEEDLSLIHI